MKSRLMKVLVIAMAAMFVISLASPAMAYAKWPNHTWNQKTFGVVKRGRTTTGKTLLIQWQCYAAKATYNGKAMKKTQVDGVLGARSEAFIKSYQLKKGLKADGVVGNGTWAKMQSYLYSTDSASDGNVIYGTNDALKVPKTSRHTQKGNWFTYNRNGRSSRVL